MPTKNTAGGVYLYAVDTAASPYGPKTGDQANITGAYSLDGGAETAGFATANPTSIGGGVYWQPLAQAETNANQASYRWSSSTSGVSIQPALVSYTAAQAYPSNFSSLSIDGSGRVDVAKVSGTSQTARDLGASVLLSSGTGTGQVSLSSGLVSLSSAQTFSMTGSITGNLSGSVGSVTGGVTLADGVAHGGTPGSSTATLAMKSINVTNPSGDAFLARSTGGGGRGFAAIGNAGGSGLTAQGGDSGHGFHAEGGGTSGDGMRAFATGVGVGFTVIGSLGSGIAIFGDTDNAAMLLMSYGTGPGIQIDTVDTGPGILIQAAGGHGVSVLAAGAGKKALLLAGDAATDALAIAAGSGSPNDIFDAAGRVAANTTQLAGQTVTAAAGVTFPASVASPTNITAGTITTVTTLTNLPAITADWLTGTGVAASAVTKIQAGLATPTNITAGTITTVTNLTNAPTSGDLTATMKTSVGTAVAASAVASVTGNVGGNVTGSVGSVTAAVTIDKTMVLSAARDVSAVADTSLTLNDALHCAIAGAAGKETVVGTVYTVKTPSTGTTVRVFTLDSSTAPTSRT